MKIYFWGGIIIALGCIVSILLNYRQFQVERDGIIVKMQISKLPNSCIGTKVKHIAVFKYRDNEYFKQVGMTFCDQHYVGEYIDMKYLAGVSFIMFPSESVIPAFYLLSVGLISGIGCIVYYFLKKNNSIK
ncbi:hypothetical protein HF324_33010 [Chitinophaga oryzae]|uniref:DUF3592 domain-containing protein n=1 Tax=Chitinophaga oryzae TaxID=2725414 RepID=A0ABX6LQH1_9BACT|nr:hypothetical protein [Chitinophaga oryzae]QJB42412.1 hypothetical protein HF324_33010 [Chitinophaga oryzae]